MPPRSATLLDVDVSRRGESHTCCKCLPTLPVSVSISHPTIARHGRRPSPCTSQLCLSTSISGLLSFSCVPAFSACVQCCPAARARTPVWHLPAELGVVAGGARRPTAWHGKQAPYLCSPLELSSTFGVAALNSVSRQTRGKPCPRSLPVLEPDIGLNLPQATHFPPTHILFRIFSSLFSAGLAICSSALAL